MPLDTVLFGGPNLIPAGPEYHLNFPAQNP